MEQCQRLLHVAPQSVDFVDYTGIDWEQVRSAHYWLYQHFRYQYPGPIKDLHQRLMVIPPARYGNQLLCGHRLHVTSSEVSISTDADDYGNSIYFLDLPGVDASVDFEVWSSVERLNDKKTFPLIEAADAARFLEHTTLTAPDAALEDAADTFAAVASSLPPLQLAEQINEWVWNLMQYTSGVTSVRTTAAEALALRQGLCQDYAHLMIALCRLLGIPARYVSGHLLGEGGSHAWVEVLVPRGKGKHYQAVAFDPTNRCRAGLRHITVAVGRDYRDVSPTSGYFTAPYSGQLTATKRAGLTSVEYFSGEVITINDPEPVSGQPEVVRIA